jgi:hypothetical protein
MNQKWLGYVHVDNLPTHKVAAITRPLASDLLAECGIALDDIASFPTKKTPAITLDDITDKRVAVRPDPVFDTLAHLGLALTFAAQDGLSLRVWLGRLLERERWYRAMKAGERWP